MASLKPRVNKFIKRAGLRREYVVREKIILRDFLAMERTRLSNERTYLTYIRTGLYFLLGAGAMLKLVEFEELRWLGWTSLGVSSVLFIVGTFRFILLRRQMRRFYTKKP
jgi:putative membrane protein